MEEVLSGIKVIEYSQLVAGPFCARILGDFGAEVLKIEPPGGDEARRRGPFPKDSPHPERSGLFLYLNFNKLGVTLNLKTKSGREILKKLLEEADVFITDLRPEEAEALDLTYEELHCLNPKLIMTAITPFGWTGPYRNYRAYHLNVFHGGGEGYLLPGGSEFSDRPPVKVGEFGGDFDAGMNAALATVAALYRRELSGEGEFVDISRQESLMALVRVDLSFYPNLGIVVSREKSEVPLGGIFPCRDGYISIVIWTEEEWKALVRLIGDPELRSERFADRRRALEHGEEANARILAWTVNFTRDELYRLGQANDIAVCPVFTPKELFESPQLRERGFFAEIEHPELGKLVCPSFPARFSLTPFRLRRPAPLLGEHNEEVYGKLGYSKEDILRLRGAGVI